MKNRILLTLVTIMSATATVPLAAASEFTEVALSSETRDAVAKLGLLKSGIKIACVSNSPAILYTFSSGLLDLAVISNQFDGENLRDTSKAGHSLLGGIFREASILHTNNEYVGGDWPHNEMVALNVRHWAAISAALGDFTDGAISAAIVGTTLCGPLGAGTVAAVSTLQAVHDLAQRLEIPTDDERIDQLLGRDRHYVEQHNREMRSQNAD